MSTKTSSDDLGLEFNNKSHYNCDFNELSVETPQEYEEYVLKFDWDDNTKVQFEGDMAFVGTEELNVHQIKTINETQGVEFVHVNSDIAVSTINVVLKLYRPQSESLNHYKPGEGDKFSDNDRLIQ
jgi:hypothetical protein